jgi:alkylated DNA repair dioxygenase AlkB
MQRKAKRLNEEPESEVSNMMQKKIKMIHQPDHSVTIPVKVRRFRCFAIKTSSESYRASNNLKPYQDSAGVTYPIDSLSELVPAVNRHLKICEKNKAFKTYISDCTGKDCPVPDGMHLFETPIEITEKLSCHALRDVNKLYKDPEYMNDPRIHMLERNKYPTNEIVFYSRTHKQPAYHEVCSILAEATPALFEYIKIYANIIKAVLGLTEDEMQQVCLSLVHYDPQAGLNPHVDTVHIFCGTLGPIFTVAMGESDKMLDMLPVLLSNEFIATRLVSKPNQIMVMDGPARILWAHAKPWRYNKEQFTVVFKFPELAKKVRVVRHCFENVEFDIPYYVE